MWRTNWGASNTAVAKLMGADSSLASRRLDSAKSDRPRQSAEACEANQKVDSNGGAQELRGESQIAGLAPFLDVPAARFKELASDTLEHVVR